MPDVYATITETDRAVQERLADVIEARAADPRYLDMVHAYLGDLALPPGATVLEIGCGTGPVTRILARLPGVGRAIGVDPSEVFIAKARALGAAIESLSFEQGDGRSLTFADGSMDAVVVHTTLSHVPSPEKVLAEAMRVLKSGACLAVFDGDYSTATVAIATLDPLEECVRAFREDFVHDPWIVRRLPRLLASAGFSVSPMRSHGYVEAPQAGYMLSWVDRGADVLVRNGRIGPEAARALKAEAQRRHSEGIWFGHIAFASVIGTRPRGAS